MTNMIRSFTLAAALLIGTAATAAEPGTPVTAEHRATLDSYRAAQVREYLDGKPRALLAPLAESVRLMPGYQKTVLGKADAATYHQAFLKRFTVSAYDRQSIEAVDLGSRVMEIGRFTMTFAEKTSAAQGTAEAQTLAGKYMDLWEKTTTGKLALHTAGWNYDQFPKDQNQFRFEDVPSVHIALRPRAPVSAGISFELAALVKLEESALLQHDGKTWALFYADDGIVFPNHHGPVIGRKALDEYVVEHAKVLPVFEKLDLRTDKIDDLGRYVIEYSSAVVNWRSGESSGVNLGKNIRVWRRSENGALQIWRAIAMYD